MKTLEKLLFKWTTSRGRNTYGYNICSLWINGEKVSSNCGGFYGLICWGNGSMNPSLKVDGGCGFSSMESILKEIGFTLEYARTYETNSQSAYIMYENE